MTPMQELEIKQLWHDANMQLENNTYQLRQQAEAIAKMQVGQHLSRMKPLKTFAILSGTAWVVVAGSIVVSLAQHASWFFTFSAGLQVVLTAIAVALYARQLLLIQQVDIDDPILVAQEKIARLRTSTLLSARVLLLQLPLWTTFYWNKHMFQHAPVALLVVQFAVTLLFTAAAGWLFVQLRYENREKKWFRLLFSGPEWQPLLRSMELLDKIETYK